MGGSRCHFRDCRVNTYNNPGMHFFRFPIRDLERYKKWREYSKQEIMLTYPLSKQKNIVICGRHFRDECFMNYKKEKLTPLAIPTIHRLQLDKALDYELDVENGVLITLKAPQLDHLIAPPGFDCLGLEHDEHIWKKVNDSQKQKRLLEEVVDDDGSAHEYINDVLEDIVQSDVANPVNKNVEKFSVESPRPALKRSYNNSMDGQSNIHASKKTKISKIIKPSEFYRDVKSNVGKETHVETKIQPNYVHNNIPKIINHQIIEIDANATLIDKESYNITENGTDYELVETRTNIEIDQDPTTIEREQTDTVILLPPAEKTLLHMESDYILKLEQKNRNLLNQKNSIEKQFQRCQKESFQKSKNIQVLKSEIVDLKKKNESLSQLLTDQSSADEIVSLRVAYEKQLEAEQRKYSLAEQTFDVQINALQSSLDMVRRQLSEAVNHVNSINEDNLRAQEEKIYLQKEKLEVEQSLQSLQEKFDNVDVEHQLLKDKYEILTITHQKLEENYKKLENQHSQSGRVTTTSNDNFSENQKRAQNSATTTPTKAQLFNGIKRYISSSMQALLRMEMFGSSDREWKQDERQVSVDLLRLGESVYNYFTDEWRLRLPMLRDVRNWLTQAVDIEQEEDL
ncbi:uncharacterized protein LOC142234130 [Haematobia irritans]|uniref:uncharacterized protein LOC142234130 n=1 Tax=Haematobia irritans TaxID=7368 RepID=UPI003F50CDEE